VQFAGCTGHGYIGEFIGDVTDMTSTRAGAAPIGLLTRSADADHGVTPNYPTPPFPAGESDGNHVNELGPVGDGNPIDNGISFPFSDLDDSAFRTDITGGLSDNILDTYLDNGLPAVMVDQAVISGQPAELSLAPLTDTKTVGQTEATTATVTDAKGPIGGTTVTFDVLNGPGAGMSGAA
jgi:hypothetical protein